MIVAFDLSFIGILNPASVVAAVVAAVGAGAGAAAVEVIHVKAMANNPR